MELLSDDWQAMVWEFISRFRAEIILVVMSGLILVCSVALFLIAPTHSQSSVVKTTSALSIPKKIPEQFIYVEISGAVLYPDVYKLPQNTRLKSLIEKAGGYSTPADVGYIEKYLNMARILGDQEKIYIPKYGDQLPLKPPSTDDSDTKIHINTASIDILTSLNGVGSATAQKIVDGRPYRSISDLVTKKILGKALFEKIKDQISL